ncbi:MAG: hypothetical protein HC781_17435 [Leptolyngbyaceae cyanobacterium CSU_1_4]|nr:hypothetical protein [Leptolyngbyaceae cyanobacterium CSU_1_4]
MAQRLKRWESPRNEGRNDKGRGGSARQRQLKKQRQALRRRLKDQTEWATTTPPPSHPKRQKRQRTRVLAFLCNPFLFDCAFNCPS